MDLSRFILKGFSHLPTKSVSLSGSTFGAVYNQTTRLDRKTYGGFVDDYDTTIMVKTSLLPNPNNLVGTVLLMDGESWRVISIKNGDIVTTLQIVSAQKL